MPDITTKKKNTNLGSGKVLFAEKLDDGSHDGFRYIRDTENFQVSVEIETLEKMTSDESTRQKERDVKISEDYTLSVDSHDTGMENLAVYYQSESEEVEQSDDSVNDEEILVKSLGRRYRLGEDIHPRGVRNVTSVSVTEDEESDPQVYVEGEDYIVHAGIGMIEVLEGGDIEEGETLRVSYDHPAVNRKEIAAGAGKEIEGILIFEADNASGENINYEFPSVKIRPEGDINLKSLNQVEWQQISWSIAAEQDDDGNFAYIEGEPYEVPE